MLLRVPYYYENFFCQASKCKHSCCVGWEIDVDKEKEKYYKSVPGSFGERLRREMTEDDKFRLKGERCAFLNEENLCDIFIALGEDALCETCSEYPRFCIRYGNIMERGLGLSCEEAARLLFLEDVPFSLVEKEVEEPEEEEMPVEEKDQKNCVGVEQARDYAIRILQDRTKSLEERMVIYLFFAKAVQECLNYNKPEKIASLIETWNPEDANKLEKNCDCLEAFYERVASYEQFEDVNAEWKETLAVTKAFIKEHAKNEKEYAGLHKEFRAYYESRIFEWEQILIYFTYRHFMWSIEDSRFFNRAQYAVSSFLMIRDMDMVRFFLNGKEYTKADRIDVARIYSTEIEHSEENVEMLAEDFDFEEVYSLQNLCEQVLL